MVMVMRGLLLLLPHLTFSNLKFPILDTIFGGHEVRI
jgi:hypothetical protein